MVVAVDEAGDDGRVRCVDLDGACVERPHRAGGSDFGDEPASDQDIRSRGRSALAVDEETAAYEQRAVAGGRE